MVSSLILPPSTYKRDFRNIKRDMAQDPQLPLPNDPNQDIWGYYELLRINPMVFDGCLVIILQLTSVNTSLITNGYKVYNLQFCIPICRKCLLLFRRWVPDTLIWWWLCHMSVRMLYVNLCVYKGTHMSIWYNLVSHRKMPWSLYALYVNRAEQIKSNCNCKVKMQTHNVAFNLNRNFGQLVLWLHKNWKYGV